MKGHIIFNGRYTSKGAVRFVEKDIWKGKGLDLEAYWNVDELNAPRMAIFNFTLRWTEILFGNYPRIVQCQWEILLMLTLNNGSEHYLTMFARLEIEVRIISCFSVSSSFLLWIVFLQERPVLPVGMATIDLDQFVASVDYLLSLTESWVQLYKL